MIVQEERRHLIEGARAHESPDSSVLVSVTARSEDPDAVLARCREVLLAVLQHADQEWPQTEQWVSLLPEWFVAACAPEQSAEEAAQWLARWRALDPAEQARIESEQPWTLSDWLYWLSPSERQWYWWDAATTSDGMLRATVAVDGSPTALGALDWLLRAAGASEVIHEDSPVY